MKNIKKLLSCTAAAALLLSSAAFAESGIKIETDGKLITADQAPIEENGSVLVPLRAILEALGQNVVYDPATKAVTAVKNISWVYFEVGSDEISSDEGNFKLSEPIKTVNDRTMLPLDAVSKALGVKTEWDKNAKTVKISTKTGDNTITEERLSKELKADDGTVVLTANVQYPVISGDSENIKKFNDILKTDAEKIASPSDEIVKYAKETYAAMKSEDREFSPCVTDRYFKNTYDKGGVISFKYADYSDFKGAHPSTVFYSETYSLSDGKKLTFEDVFAPVGEKIAKNAFIEKIKAHPEMFFEDAEKTVNEADIKNNFYLTENGAVFYFNVYEIAPYAAGLQTAEIRYESGAFSDDFIKTIK